MTVLRAAVQYELALLVACIALTGAWKIVRGILRPGGLRAIRDCCGGGIAGALRWQMLALTVVFAGFYLAGSLQSAGSATLPAIPNYALALLGSSQAAFLGAAAWRRLRPIGTLRNEEEK
jgi:hypothetical protein